MAANSDIKQLLAQIESLKPEGVVSEANRLRLVDGLKAAIHRLQKPWETAWDHNWTNQATFLCVKTLVDAGVFKSWVEAGGESMTTTEIAKLGNIEPSLTGRLLSHLAAQELLLLKAEGVYSLTPWAAALAEEIFTDVYSYGEKINIPCFNHFPDFAKQTKYENPTATTSCNWENWGGCGKSVFEGFKKNPQIGKTFNSAMVMISTYKTPWVNLYPGDRIIAARKKDRVLVVDIGGGRGHDLQRFCDKYPDLPTGSLVLQDLPEVIDQATVQSPAVTQGHDFFKPQPIKGAHIYYMHVVIHDWPEKEAVQILRHITDAMEKGYSKVLLYDTVLDPSAPRLHGSTMDITMLACLSAAERTVMDWHNLAEKAGLKITNIFRSPEAVEAIIELELV